MWSKSALKILTVHAGCLTWLLAEQRLVQAALWHVVMCTLGAVVGCFFVLSWSNSCPSAFVLQGTRKLHSALFYFSVPADSQTSQRLQNATACHLHTFKLCEM